jgi:hypothetical protein
MNVSFIRCTTIAAFTNAVNTSSLSEGGIYFITVKNDPLILSVAIATGNNSYELIMGNIIATKPTFGMDGQSLEYYDAGGNKQSVDLNLYTIGDKNNKSSELPSIGVDGFYMGTIGDGGMVSSLPVTGVTIGDFINCISAGTYAGISLAVGDYIRATSNNPITWAKAIPGTMSGTLKNGDTISNAFRKLSTNLDDQLSGFVPYSIYNSRISNIEDRLKSIIKLKGTVASQVI